MQDILKCLFCPTCKSCWTIASHDYLHLFPVCLERRTSEVAQTSSREAPKHVPPGDDRARHRSPPFLSLCGLQIPGRRLCLPQGGMSWQHLISPSSNEEIKNGLYIVHLNPDPHQNLIELHSIAFALFL